MDNKNGQKKMVRRTEWRLVGNERMIDLYGFSSSIKLFIWN